MPSPFPSHGCSSCGKLVNELGRHGAARMPKAHMPATQANEWSSANKMPLQCSRVSQGPSHPDGLTLYPWSQGKSLVWDFTCSDTLAPSHVPATSTEAGRAAAQAEGRKLNNYNELSGSYIIQPVAVETMGSWGQMGLKFVRELGSKIADVNGEKRSTAFLFQSLGMAIQRGNAVSVTGTAPNAKSLHELFYL